ncbi:TauD/TfdA dioxygenase family protein [Glacieibacterium frigidum]|uniref:TauD/TfdA family dioxygenase n=1 Tax=Glacieibacterium frigidum TaxID=2593303 RepID=A0A552U8V7_9SPHN|nr:TauD/TfdA family dioxygenase [Glacieibacterium frigidum]TRW14645.1 TauD/TfdA family dioxygenase [Glacieibacterium frigidum]
MTPLDIALVSPRIGAEVRGLDLATLDAGGAAQLRAALWHHRVLFLRDQHLDDASHEAAACLLGEIAPYALHGGGDALLEMDAAHGGKANVWHTDSTFEAEPPLIAMLRAVVVPAVGGDTLWANTEAAYRALPLPLRGLADALTATHSNAYDFAGSRPGVTRAAAERYAERFTTAQVFRTAHSVARPHPATGEPCLFLGNFVTGIEGWAATEASAVLGALQAYVVQPENTVRWRWRAGDVAIWDNAATQHYALDDYGEAPRVMKRATIRR